MFRKYLFITVTSIMLIGVAIAFIGASWYSSIPAVSFSNEKTDTAGEDYADTGSIEKERVCGPGKPFYGCPAYIFNAKPVENLANDEPERVCGPGKPFYGCPAYIFNVKPVENLANDEPERVCGPGKPFYGCPAYIFNAKPVEDSSISDSSGD